MADDGNVTLPQQPQPPGAESPPASAKTYADALELEALEDSKHLIKFAAENKHDLKKDTVLDARAGPRRLRYGNLEFRHRRRFLVGIQRTLHLREPGDDHVDLLERRDNHPRQMAGAPFQRPSDHVPFRAHRPQIHGPAARSAVRSDRPRLRREFGQEHDGRRRQGSLPTRRIMSMRCARRSGRIKASSHCRTGWSPALPARPA